jgi:hypothetical protein
MLWLVVVSTSICSNGLQLRPKGGEMIALLMDGNLGLFLITLGLALLPAAVAGGYLLEFDEGCLDRVNKQALAIKAVMWSAMTILTILIGWYTIAVFAGGVVLVLVGKGILLLGKAISYIMCRS